MEASPRIELGCKDLQSSASPLRHEAILIFLVWWAGNRGIAEALQEAVFTSQCFANKKCRQVQARLRSRLFRRRRIHQSSALRRKRRTAETSWESTTTPTGIIQKPRTGRKPRRPPNTRPTPMPIRAQRALGRRSVHLPSFICLSTGLSFCFPSRCRIVRKPLFRGLFEILIWGA